MGQTTIKGVREDGIFETEHKSTPVLITELIGKVHKLCGMEIYNALCYIRESSERDERVRQTYAHALRKFEAERLEVEG